MLIYEVNLEVDKEAEQTFIEWLPFHIKQILVLPGFEKANWFSIESLESSSDKVLWTVHYWVQNRELLEKYFTDHAPTLRADGLKRFGGKFKATRRILTEITI